jgi:hypothetical protein
MPEWARKQLRLGEQLAEVIGSLNAAALLTTAFQRHALHHVD